MLTDERLKSIEETAKAKEPMWHPDAVVILLIDEIKRLRAELSEAHETVTIWMKDLGAAERERDALRSELARYKTPNVDEIEVKP